MSCSAAVIDFLKAGMAELADAADSKNYSGPSRNPPGITNPLCLPRFYLLIPHAHHELRSSSSGRFWQARLEDFEKGLIGFGKDIEKNLLDVTSPFVFSPVNERSILRLLKLIACDNGKIGTYTKLVDDRNDTAHANGHIFFSTQAALDAKITEILRVVDEIQTYSTPVIEQRTTTNFCSRTTTPRNANIPTLPTSFAKSLSTGITFRRRTSRSALLRSRHI